MFFVPRQIHRIGCKLFRFQPRRQSGFTPCLEDAWSESDLAVLPANLRPNESESLDLILREKIYMLQSRNGFRVNVDATILAYFASRMYLNSTANASSPRPLRVLDMGAGTGLLSILFAKAHPPDVLHLLEMQPRLAIRAKRNLQLNDMQGIVSKFDIHGGQLPTTLHSAFDVVLVNPPFYRRGSRKHPSDRERRLAFMESSALFSDFMGAARLACDSSNPNAFIAVIHDINEQDRLQKSFSENHLTPSHVQHVRHNETAAPSRILFHLQPLSDSNEGQPSTANDVALSATLDPLTISPQTSPDKRYSEEIELFLQRIPLPSLKIGRVHNVKQNMTSEE